MLIKTFTGTLIDTTINHTSLIMKTFIGTLRDIANNPTSLIHDGLRALCLWFCQVIYSFFAKLYQLFILLSKVKFLAGDTIISDIYSRVTILLGLIMLFVCTFYLIRLMLDPDKINDKEKGLGNLFKRVITSLLLLGFTPLLFSIAFDIQHAVVDSNFLSKLILAETVEDNEAYSDYLERYGRVLESNLFMTFYNQRDDVYEDEEMDTPQSCLAYEYVQQEIIDYGTLTVAKDCVNKKGWRVEETTGDQMYDYIIDYDALLAIIVGLIMVWLLIVYSLNVGVRTVQLAFLQIMAPVPIMSYILPTKDSMLGRWFKQVVTTYIDLFVRLIIIYFVIYITRYIWNVYDLFDGLGNVSIGMQRWIRVIITIALFLFARRFPQLLQELTGKPSAASLGFGLGGSNMAAGFLIGTASLARMNWDGSHGIAKLTGAARGIYRGAFAGTAQGDFNQNMQRARQREQDNNRLDEWLTLQGYHFPLRHIERIRMNAGGITRGEIYSALNQEYAVFDEALGRNRTVRGVRGIQNAYNTGGISSALTFAANSGLVNPGDITYDAHDQIESVIVRNERGAVLAILNQNSTTGDLADLTEAGERFALETPGVDHEAEFRSHRGRIDSLERRAHMPRTFQHGIGRVGNFDNYHGNVGNARQLYARFPSLFGTRGGPQWRV